MKPCKMVIFDLDGTILDTLADLTDSVNHALRLHGYPEQSSDTVRSALGNGARRLIEKCVPAQCTPEEIDAVTQEHNRYYAGHCCLKTAPYTDIPQLLRLLREKGFLTAVVSNKPDNAVQPVCKHYFGELLDYAVGQTEGTPRKPSPDAIWKLLGKYSLSPEETVYVGDTEVDYQTAANAHTSCILVSWGFRDRKELVKLENPLLADNTRELCRMLLSLRRGEHS